MTCTDVKKEMELLAEGLKIGTAEKFTSEENADLEAERINKTFSETFRVKLIELFKGNKEFVESLNLDKKSFFYGIYEFYDEAKGEEYQQMFWDLNLNWFEVQEEILHHDCGGYELDYDLSSELDKFFSESPERRRKRLEEPLERKIQEIDRKLEELDVKTRENKYYQVKFNKEVFLELVDKLESLTYEN